MKLRNKKTGEIDDVSIVHSANKIKGVVEHEDGVQCMFAYTLKEFNEEWEDYKEPKDIWWLDNEGNVNHATSEVDNNFEKNREIGNYFGTKEEAEKAVEKLKAWKRLKDKGFRLERWCFSDPKDEAKIFIKGNCVPDIVEELDLLFGGKE